MDTHRPVSKGYGGEISFLENCIIKNMVSSHAGTNIPSYFEFIPYIYPSEFLGKITYINVKSNKISMKKYLSDLRNFAQENTTQLPFKIINPTLFNTHWARVCIAFGISLYNMIYLNWLNIINVDSKGPNILISINFPGGDIDAVCIDHALSYYMTNSKVQTPYKVGTIESERHGEVRYEYNLSKIISRLCKEFGRLYNARYIRLYGKSSPEVDIFNKFFTIIDNPVNMSTDYIELINKLCSKLSIKYKIPGKCLFNKYKGIKLILSGKDCSKYLPITQHSIDKMNKICNNMTIPEESITTNISYFDKVASLIISKLKLLPDSKEAELIRYITRMMIIPCMIHNESLIKFSGTSAGIDIKKFSKLRSMLKEDYQELIISYIAAFSSILSIRSV